MAEGPFDKYLSPWDKIRQSSNVEDRRDDPWPWHKISTTEQQFRSTPTVPELIGLIQKDIDKENIPPVTSLSRDAGARDVSPITSEELLRFLLQVDSHNPDPKVTRR